MGSFLISTMIENTPSYFAIIPADVRYSTKLVAGAKLLYGEITALCNKEGFCWASNSYFAKLYENDVNTISRWINELVEAGFIKSVIDRKGGNIRRIYLSPNVPIPILKSEYTPIPKNEEHNSTSINSKKNAVNSKNLELDLKERKTKFFNVINGYKDQNPHKYPSTVYGQFFKYWTEINELDGGAKMRFESQDYFEIGKRLSTFWNRVKPEEKELWKRQDIESEPQLDLFNLANEKKIN